MEPITISIHFLSGYAVQSGYGLAGILDNTITKDDKGLPYIPGTTLKGVIREACEEIALLKRHRPYETVIEEMKNITKNGGDLKDPNVYGPITRLFGTPFIPSALEFHSAYLKKHGMDPATREFIRKSVSWNESHTSISYATGTAKKDHLFSMEVASPDFDHPDYIFCFDIVPAAGLVDNDLLSLLFCGIRLVDHIGSGKTRGKGLVKMEIPAKYAGKSIDDWIAITFNPNWSEL
ncbi:MAG: hypothetical protein B1H11_04875 [Desulfobacteraceae bacterium 4484_190.1]|nr:MAG: hypothetical protein B1H11_04875 [Desulfobacteraceae bacterium 4484_190.1]